MPGSNGRPEILKQAHHVSGAPVFAVGLSRAGLFVGFRFHMPVFLFHPVDPEEVVRVAVVCGVQFRVCLFVAMNAVAFVFFDL